MKEERSILTPCGTQRAVGLRAVVFAALASSLLLLTGCAFFLNAPPEGYFTATPEEGHAPLLVRFNASGSVDRDGTIRSYTWSFGDGTSGSGLATEHRFTASGTYAASLTVADDDGATSQVVHTIHVRPPNAAPVASFTVSPSSAEAGQLVAFDASASLDSDGRILSYTWDYGDGSAGFGVAVQHAFVAAGTYTVTLTAADDDGTTSTQSHSVLITTRNRAPVASFTVSPSPACIAESVRFDAQASYDPDGKIVSYTWDFGDGHNGLGAVVTHQYSAAGSYVVRLAVTDDGGATASSTRGLTVSASSSAGVSIARHYEWAYEGLLRTCDLSIPRSLYEEYHSRPRAPLVSRDYDEYVLDPLDADLVRALTSEIAATSGSDYYSVAESALAFVQATIAYVADPGPFDYPRYPAETLVDLIGDCEDTAILYASLVRTLGHGALIVAVDTDRDGVADHMVTFVPVDQAYAETVSCPCSCRAAFWNYGGKLYAIGETAVDGWYIPLGCDPWGLQDPDLKEIWDVSKVDVAPKVERWTPHG